MRCLWGIFVCVLTIVFSPVVSYAQMRIIPQEVVQEAATPSKIENVGIAFEGGEVVNLGTIDEEGLFVAGNTLGEGSITVSYGGDEYTLPVTVSAW